MRRYFVLKLLWIVPVVLVVSGATFMMMHLIPGDPVDALMVGETLDAEGVAALRQKWGLDKPVYVQYATWMGRVLKGDLGRSIRTSGETSDELRLRLPITLELVLFSKIISLAVGIPVGAIAGRRPGSKIDAAATAFAGATIGMPSFLIGMVLILVTAIKLQWLPVAGYVPPSENLLEHLKLLVMPSLVLGMAFLPIVVQQTRSSVLEVYGEMFIVTARSKGLAEGRVFSRHALKIVLLPIVTLTGLSIGHMFGSGMIVEILYGIPGTGRFLVESILSRDYVAMQGTVLVIASTVLFFNLFVDVIYVYLDPRIKYG